MTQIAAIVPQFFSADIPATLRYYQEALGFEHQFEYGAPTQYAGVIKDGLSIFFRHIPEPMPHPSAKYTDELLDAYIRPNDIHALYEEYTGRGVSLHRPLAKTPWGFTEFVVQDIDGRLLCFGQLLDAIG